MAKRRKKALIVKIEDVEYPNRFTGHALEKEGADVEEVLQRDVGREDFSTWKASKEVFGKGGLPGQIYKARAKRNRKGKTQVDLEDLLQESPLERKSPCSVSHKCGGCNYQTLSYDQEVALKKKQINQLFQDFDLWDQEIDLRRSPKIQAYRNKMEYSFGDAYKDGPLRLGLHRPGFFYEIVPTPDCNIVPKDFVTIQAYIQDLAEKKGLSFYHKGTRSGYLRHCVIRSSHIDQELMVNLVTTSQEGLDEEGLQGLVQGLLSLDLEGDLVSIFHTTNDALADAVIPEKVDHLYGKEALREELLGLKFEVGPFSFFQPNVYTAEIIYSIALDYAGDMEGKLAYDLFCGTGTITQLLAKKAKKVIGVEINEEAIEKAKESAAYNGIDNIEFIANDVLDELDALKERGKKPDLVLIDPPRGGIHPKALAKIIAAQPSKLVYVSCNPRSMVSDIRTMVDAGYVLEKVEAVDQFPRTKHLECIALIQREIM